MNNEIRVQAVLAEIDQSLTEHRGAAARGELALTLARKLDDGTAGPSTAAIARELRAVLGELEQIKPDSSPSKLEDLHMRRKLRLVGLWDEYEARVAAQVPDPKSRRQR